MLLYVLNSRGGGGNNGSHEEDTPTLGDLTTNLGIARPAARSLSFDRYRTSTRHSEGDERPKGPTEVTFDEVSFSLLSELASSYIGYNADGE